MDDPKSRAGTKPAPVPVIAANVPAILKAERRWVGWRWVWKGNKWDKPPVCARDGSPGKSNDPATWSTFDEAIAAQHCDGIGFVLGESGGRVFSGLDLDKSVVNGQLSVEAGFLAGVLDSYTELSPSGNGVKVFTIGALPPGRKKDDARGVEFYDSGRYFTVTGHKIPGYPDDVQERTQKLAELHGLIFPPAPPEGSAKMADRDVALSALAGLSPSRAASYSDWVLVGMALHSVADDLLDAWDKWSQGCPEKYQAGACEKKWRGFKRSGVGIGSLVHWAKADGWTYPRQSSGVNGTSLHGDPHMGDGLTEADGAGPWHLRVEVGNPKRYWLKSPIWADSDHLADGYVGPLSKKQLSQWSLLRIEAMDQSGVHVLPDNWKKPVWDGRKGRQLLRTLLEHAEIVETTVDRDQIREALEYIVEVCDTAPILEATDYQQLSRKSIARLDDGSIVFKVRGIAAVARREKQAITVDAIKEAAAQYATEFRPRFDGRRLRYWQISKNTLDEVSNLV